MITPEERRRRLLEDHERIDFLMKKGVALAVEEHRRAGVPIVVWQDGKVVEIPASEIPPIDPKFLDDAPAAPSPSERQPARSA